MALDQLRTVKVKSVRDVAEGPCCLRQTGQAIIDPFGPCGGTSVACYRKIVRQYPIESAFSRYLDLVLVEPPPVDVTYPYTRELVLTVPVRDVVVGDVAFDASAASLER